MQFFLLAAFLPAVFALATPQTYSYLDLPADFDYSHPALNYAAIQAALEADPNYVIPQLPAEVLALQKTVEMPAFSVAADTWLCETSSGSPRKDHVNTCAFKLNQLTNTQCCNTNADNQCTVMWNDG